MGLLFFSACAQSLRLFFSPECSTNPTANIFLLCSALLPPAAAAGLVAGGVTA
jgi:hypothetical protein